MISLTDKRGFHPGMREFIATTLKKKADQLIRHGRKFYYSVFEPNKVGLEYITSLVNAEKIKPQVGCVFPLDKVFDAYDAVDTQHVRGKIVLKVKL